MTGRDFLLHPFGRTGYKQNLRYVYYNRSCARTIYIRQAQQKNIPLTTSRSKNPSSHYSILVHTLDRNPMDNEGPHTTSLEGNPSITPTSGLFSVEHSQSAKSVDGQLLTAEHKTVMKLKGKSSNSALKAGPYVMVHPRYFCRVHTRRLHTSCLGCPEPQHSGVQQGRVGY